MADDDSSFDDGMDDPEMIQLTELIKKMDVGADKKAEKDVPEVPADVQGENLVDEVEDDPEADAQIASLLSDMNKLDKLGD